MPTKSVSSDSLNSSYHFKLLVIVITYQLEKTQYKLETIKFANKGLCIHLLNWEPARGFYNFV